MEAVEALAKLTKKTVVPVKVLLGLHLKTSVTYLGKNILILNSSSIDTAELSGFKWIETGNANRYAANCLAIGNTVLMSKGSNVLANKIHREGFKVIELDISEFEKADGGITCLSIVLNDF
jgi:dimethylargininase